MSNNGLCGWCDQPLIHIEFTRHIVLVCDNTFCPGGFRERQGIMARNGDEPEQKPKGLPSVRVLRPGYQQYNAEAKENYRFARSLDIPSIAARDLRHKSKAEIKKRAKEFVTV